MSEEQEPEQDQPAAPRAVHGAFRDWDVVSKNPDTFGDNASLIKTARALVAMSPGPMIGQTMAAEILKITDIGKMSQEDPDRDRNQDRDPEEHRHTRTRSEDATVSRGRSEVVGGC